MSMNGTLVQLTPAQLATLSVTPKEIRSMLGSQPALDLGKMWNGLQYLLESYEVPGRRQPELLNQAVIGGVVTGPDLGYGPACVLPAEDVQQLAAELADVDGARLRACFDPDDMRRSDTYPSSIWSEGEPVLHELMTCFVELVAFYQEAAASGNGLATYVA